jgi:hypothetical protein
MSRNRQKPKPANQADIFLQESRSMFNGMYQETKQPYILMARNILEELVDQGMVTAQEAISTLHSPADFSALLLKAEQKYKDQEDQIIHAKMASLERNTDWKAAAAVSLSAGMVTGLVFAVVGPFLSSWLQPTADELFKRQPAARTTALPQPQIVQNIGNENVYNIYGADTKSAGEHQPQPTDAKKPHTVLSCKNATVGTYQKTLPELLQRGDVVTLEVNGKKISMCYRPNMRRTEQGQALVQ